MDYLYIPTTTLNFNNILSTGSISPAGAYAVRRFGYKQFEVVEPNPFRNSLLLYDRYPAFTIEATDRDSHPLVLRLRADRLPESLVKQPGRKSDVHVYSCDETIYFDPSSVDFFFASSDAKQIALTKSEPSFTTKLVELYRPWMHVQSPKELNTFEWSAEVLEGIQDGNKEIVLQSCESDSHVNRLKGFASGYIIGAYKSTNPKVADARSKVRAIRNLASAMLNDPTSKYSDSERKDVDFSCVTLERFFAKGGIDTQRFDPWRGDNIRIDSGKIITDIRDRNETDARFTQSLVRLVNDYCLTSDFYEHLDEERLNVALAGAQAIRADIGLKWEGSPWQTYINDLLNNIKSGSAFDFNDCSSLAIKAFAAFILKGDDLNKLEAFLTTHGIGDFRIPFALWGAMFGFSKISKTFYNLPFERGDADYARKMHNYVHSVIHKIPLKALERPVPPQDKPYINDNASMVNSRSSPTLARERNDEYSQLFHDVCREFPGFKESDNNFFFQLLSNNGGLNKNFIDDLEKNFNFPYGTKTKALKYLKLKLKSTSLGHNPQLDLMQAIKFWDDTQAWEVLREHVTPENQSRVESDLRWFQDQWKDPHSPYYGWLNTKAKANSARKRLDERTNDDAVKAFCNVLKDDPNNKKKMKGISDRDLEIVRRVLMNRYR